MTSVVIFKTKGKAWKPLKSYSTLVLLRECRGWKVREERLLHQLEAIPASGSDRNLDVSVCEKEALTKELSEEQLRNSYRH